MPEEPRILRFDDRSPRFPLIVVPFEGREYRVRRPGDMFIDDHGEALDLARAAMDARDDEALLDVVRRAQPFVARLVREHSAEDADVLEGMRPEKARYVVETVLDVISFWYVRDLRTIMKELDIKPGTIRFFRLPGEQD